MCVMKLGFFFFYRRLPTRFHYQTVRCFVEFCSCFCLNPVCNQPRPLFGLISVSIHAFKVLSFLPPPAWDPWMWSSWGDSARWWTSCPSSLRPTRSPWRRGTTLNRRWVVKPWVETKCLLTWAPFWWWGDLFQEAEYNIIFCCSLG